MFDIADLSLEIFSLRQIILIQVGDYNLEQNDQDEQMFEIEDFVVHPKFAVGECQKNMCLCVSLSKWRQKQHYSTVYYFFQFSNNGYYFSGGHYNNDVAVIRIKPQRGNGFQMSRFVSPACLPTSSTKYTPGTLCQVSGWGLTDGEHNFSINNNLNSTGYITHSFSI